MRVFLTLATTLWAVISCAQSTPIVNALDRSAFVATSVSLPPNAFVNPVVTVADVPYPQSVTVTVSYDAVTFSKTLNTIDLSITYSGETAFINSSKEPRCEVDGTHISCSTDPVAHVVSVPVPVASLSEGAGRVTVQIPAAAVRTGELQVLVRGGSGNVHLGTHTLPAPDFTGKLVFDDDPDYGSLVLTPVFISSAIRSAGSVVIAIKSWQDRHGPHATDINVRLSKNGFACRLASGSYHSNYEVVPCTLESFSGNTALVRVPVSALLSAPKNLHFFFNRNFGNMFRDVIVTAEVVSYKSFTETSIVFPGLGRKGDIAVYGLAMSINSFTRTATVTTTDAYTSSGLLNYTIIHRVWDESIAHTDQATCTTSYGTCKIYVVTPTSSVNVEVSIDAREVTVTMPDAGNLPAYVQVQVGSSNGERTEVSNIFSRVFESSTLGLATLSHSSTSSPFDTPYLGISARFAAVNGVAPGSGSKFAIHLPASTPVVSWNKCFIATGASAYLNATTEISVQMQGAFIVGQLPSAITLSSTPVFVSFTCSAAPTAINVFPIKGDVAVVLEITRQGSDPYAVYSKAAVDVTTLFDTPSSKYVLALTSSLSLAPSATVVTTAMKQYSPTWAPEVTFNAYLIADQPRAIVRLVAELNHVAASLGGNTYAHGFGSFGYEGTLSCPSGQQCLQCGDEYIVAPSCTNVFGYAADLWTCLFDAPLPSYGGCPLSVAPRGYTSKTVDDETHIIFTADVSVDPKIAGSKAIVAIELPVHLAVTAPACTDPMGAGWCNAGDNVAKIEVSVPANGSLSVLVDIPVAVAPEHNSSWSLGWSVTVPAFNRTETGSATVSVPSSSAVADVVAVTKPSEGTTVVDIHTTFSDPAFSSEVNYIDVVTPAGEAWACKALVSISAGAQWVLRSSDWASAPAGRIPLPAGLTADQVTAIVVSCSSSTASAVDEATFSTTFGSSVFGPVVTIASTEAGSDAAVGKTIIVKTVEFDTAADIAAITAALAGDTVAGYKDISVTVDGSVATINVLLEGSSAIVAHADATLVSVLQAADSLTVVSSAPVYTGPAGDVLTVSCGNTDEATCTAAGATVPAAACAFAPVANTDSACPPTLADSALSATADWDKLVLSFTGSAAGSVWVVERDYALVVAMPQGLRVGTVNDSLVCALASGVAVTCAVDSEDQDSLVVHIPYSAFTSDAVSVTAELVTTTEVLAPFTLTYSLVDAASGETFTEPKTITLTDSLNYADVSAHVAQGIANRGTLTIFLDLSSPHVPSLVSREMSFSVRGTAGPLSDCSAVLFGSTRFVSYFTKYNAATGYLKLDETRSGDHVTALNPYLMLTCASTVAADEILEVFALRAHGRVRVASVAVPAAEAAAAELCHRAALRLVITPEDEDEEAEYSSIQKSNMVRLLTLGFFDQLVDMDAEEQYFSVNVVNAEPTELELAAVFRVCSAASDAAHPEWAPAADAMVHFLLSAPLAQKVLSTAFSAAYGVSTVVHTSGTLVSVPPAEIDFKCASLDGADNPSSNNCALKECSLELVTPMKCYYASDFTAVDDECAMREPPVLKVHSCHASIADVAYAVALNDSTVAVDFLVVSSEGEDEILSLVRDIAVQFTVPAEYLSDDIQVFRVNPDMSEEPVAFSVVVADGKLSVSLEKNADARYRVVIKDVTDAAATSDAIFLASRSVVYAAGSVLFNSQAAFCTGATVSVAENNDDKEVFIKIASTMLANVSGTVVFGSSLLAGAQCGFTELPNPDEPNLSTFLPLDFAGIVSTSASGRSELLGSFDGSSGAGVRCAASASVSPVQIAIRAEDGLLYKSFVMSPIAIEDVSTLVYAVAIESNTTSPGVHAALLDSIPVWAAPAISVAVLSTTGDVEALAFRLRYGIQMYFPTVGAVVTAFRNTANITVIVPENIDSSSPSFGNVFVATQAGEWLCAGHDGSWVSCSVADNCGDEYSSTLACVSAARVHTAESLDALIVCSFADAPPSLPVWTGCGSFACVDEAGSVIACDSPSLCVEGCATDVALTPEIIASEIALKPVCVKDSVIVSDTLCPSDIVAAPVYALTCDAKSACGPVCMDAEGARLDCDSDAAWDSCSVLCGNGTQTIHHYACAHKDAPMGAIVAETVSDSFCGNWTDGPGFPTERACTSLDCSTYAFYCRPVDGADAEWRPCTNDERYGFGACSTNCGSGKRHREVGCGEVDSLGNIVSISEDDNAHHCSNMTEAEASEDCEDNSCPDTVWMCEDAGGVLVDCDSAPLPACPSDSCHAASTVTRAVVCANNGVRVDNSLCTATAPSSSSQCPQVTTGCSVLFRDDAPCRAAGQVVTCQDSESEPAEREGICVDAAGATVPSEWCSSSLVSACSLAACDCPEGFSGFNCETGPSVPEPGVVTVTVTIEASSSTPNEYTVHWTVPSPAINDEANLTLVLLGDDGSEVVIDLGLVPIMDGAAVFDATEVGALPGKYIVEISLPGRVSGKSEVFDIVPLCSVTDFTCVNGECDLATGECVCPGDWTGPRCSESPCATKGCNPTGSICSVSAADEAVCDCVTDDEGRPLFTGPLCLTPVSGCEDEAPCAHGGVRNGSLLDNGEIDCGECACEAFWAGSLCESCGLDCLNGGEQDAGCSQCVCAKNGGYYGDSCECRVFFMRFVVLAKDLPFTLDAASSEDERAALLDGFAASFANDLAEISSMQFVSPDGPVTEYVAKDKNTVLTLNFVVGPDCSQLSGTVSDDSMRPTYSGVTALKSIMNDKEHSSRPFVGLADTPSGFAAFDPNCKLLTGCPSNFARGAVYVPADTAVDPGEGETEVPSKKSSGLSTGALAGIIAGSISFLLLLLLLLLAFCCGWCCFKKNDQDDGGNDGPNV